MPFVLMIVLTLACIPDPQPHDDKSFWPDPLIPAPFGLDPVVWRPAPHHRHHRLRLC